MAMSGHNIISKAVGDGRELLTVAIQSQYLQVKDKVVWFFFQCLTKPHIKINSQKPKFLRGNQLLLSNNPESSQP